MHVYLADFGFGAATGVDLPGEGAGILPSREWKQQRYQEPWYPGETVIAGIGQGFNIVTPLQLATAVAALANGGKLWAPRVVYAVKHAEAAAAERRQAPLRSQLPLRDAANWQLVLEGMRRVVNGPRGTAREIAATADVVIAGKTGTAQVYALSRDRRDDEEVAEALRDHALFIAFAPFDAPTIAVAVVVDHGGAGSRAAAPVAAATIAAWIEQEHIP